MRIVDMKLTSIRSIFVKLFILLFLLSCGSGGETQLAGGGIGGTGVIVGAISAFGSVVVNDVTIATDNATITVNGDPASANDLKIGMIVEVKGQFEADGITGTADSIVYDKDLQGPISNIAVIDDRTKELTVLGQTVVIDRTQTRFDEPAISFDTVAIDDVIEVSGLVDSNAVFRATWIKLADNPDEFEVKGMIRMLDQNNETFMINDLIVDYRNADTSELPGGVPQDDQFVSATGKQIGPSGELIADAVVPDEMQPQASEGDYAKIEGFITSVDPSSEYVLEFEVDRWSVAVTDQTVFENGSLSDIQPDKNVEVEGKVNASGLLVAERILFQINYAEDFAKAVAQGPNGNIYVTGYTKGQTTDFNYMTVKYDATLTRQWVRYFDAGYFDEDRAEAIAVDGEGNVYVSGYTETNDNDLDFLTVKYDSSGNELWAETYDFGIGDVDGATAIALDSAGNAYVTGYSKTNDSDFDYVTVIYDPSGNVNFFARYDGDGMEDKAQGIAVDGDYVYVTGYSKGDGTDFDYATVCYDKSDGTEIWAETYDFGIGDVDVATAIALDSSGKAFVTGYSKTNDSDFDYVTVIFDPIYDPSGNVTVNVNIFARYDNGDGLEDKAWGVIVDTFGNVYITGSSEYSDTDFDYLTVKYNNSGELQWNTRYDGATMEDAAQAVSLDNQGNIIVTGYSKGKYSDYDFTSIVYEEPAANLVEIKWIDRYDGFYP